MRFFLLFIFFLVDASFAHAESMTGKVVGVTDGDTLTVLVDGNQQHKIRLVEIDAPESGQPFGSQSKQALAKLTFQKNVRVDIVGRDRYQRLLGRVYVDDIDVNRELISSGYAWAYRKYISDHSLLSLEADAQANQRGLWSLPENEKVAPWEWRKTGNKADLLNLVDEKQEQEFQCKGKRTCGQMVSCEEAKFYLKVCGVKSLDRDRDGIPCESLCG
ncbi:thermonuclease family protein [Cellvibrio mixtus]|uniref:thermonuclease family protein n=1 Tax=Cellvibrio mixtus TaxID=39650 RepID=UPI0005873A6B|nr:thermonuclease family protein [Cellvibrio mixtus]